MWVLLFFLLGIPLQGNAQPSEKAIKISSSAFKQGEAIPAKYTCDGENVSPPLSWTWYPKRTQSFAIIADDPDAPMGTWVHWVIYNIPASVNDLDENLAKTDTLQNGIMQGITDFRRPGYGGPCPPGGTHRYFFKIYALDIMLKAKPGLSKAELLKAMKGHIIAEGQLMGKYKRKR